MLMAIAAGGALGAVGRHFVITRIGGCAEEFPWATLIVNLIGSFALGVLIELITVRWTPTPEVRAFMIVGLMGAFTTFSSVSMDTYFLLERGKIAVSVTYAGSSILLCTAGFGAGLMLLRRIWL